MHGEILFEWQKKWSFSSRVFFLAKLQRLWWLSLRTRYLVNLCNTHQTNQVKAKFNAPLNDQLLITLYKIILALKFTIQNLILVLSKVTGWLSPSPHRIQVIPTYFFCTLINYYGMKSYLQHDHSEMYRDESHQKDVGPLHVSGDSRWTL